MSTMTKGERTELLSLMRKRERVLKAAAHDRSLQLLAEFDTQSAQVYKFDDDEIWKAATERAHEVVAEAQEQILARCKELGIPVEFAPGLSLGWHGRGQNAAAERRQELRRMAKSKIEALEQEATVKIERMGLAAQEQIIAHGLDSPAAKAFFDNMPAIESLMPPISPIEVKALIESRKRKDEWRAQHFAVN